MLSRRSSEVNTGPRSTQGLFGKRSAEVLRGCPSSGVHVITRLGFTDELLLLYSAVLEPDGDLALREVGAGRDSPPLVFGDELAGCVLFLQLLQLELSVRNAFLTSPPVAADFGLQRHDVWEKKETSI